MAFITLLRYVANSSATVRLRWDSKSYHDVVRSQDGGNPVAEERFRRQYAPLDRPDLEILPSTTWDNTGRCELWYLPQAILESRQVVLSCHNLCRTY